jgi:hypothetical protein
VIVSTEFVKWLVRKKCPVLLVSAMVSIDILEKGIEGGPTKTAALCIISFVLVVKIVGLQSGFLLGSPPSQVAAFGLMTGGEVYVRRGVGI